MLKCDLLMLKCDLLIKQCDLLMQKCDLLRGKCDLLMIGGSYLLVFKGLFKNKWPLFNILTILDIF